MRIAISKLSFELILLCLTFFEPTVVPHYLFLAFKYVVLLFLFIKCVSNIASQKLLFTSILLYGGVTIFSTIVNQIAANTIVASFFYMIQIIDIFIFLKSYLLKHSIKELVHYVLIVFLAICILTDISMVFITYDFENSAEEYFIGSKFAVSYLHAFVLAILSNPVGYRKYRFNLGVIAFAILSIYVCAKVNCATGLCVNIAVICLSILPESVKRLAMSGKSLIVLTVVMNILIFGSVSLLTTQVVQNVITNILHRNASLTGRTQIYSILLSKIAESPFIGYGYYNNVIGNALNYGNAQNGVMKILLDSGLLGLIGYVGIVYLSLNKKSKFFDEHWAFYAFLYSMVIASAVEINLTYMIVFFAMAVVFTYSERVTINELVK